MKDISQTSAEMRSTRTMEGDFILAAIHNYTIQEKVLNACL